MFVLWSTVGLAAEPDFVAIARDYLQWPAAVESAAPPHVMMDCRMPIRGVDTPHHGDRVIVHVNEAGRAAFAQAAGARTFPVGTVLVKVKLQSFDATSTPLGLGIMVKREAGFAPDGGDWQYAMFEGGEVHADTTAMQHCAACHTNGTVDDQPLEGARLASPRDSVFLSGPIQTAD